jgi:hypothetical protein
MKKLRAPIFLTVICLLFAPFVIQRSHAARTDVHPQTPAPAQTQARPQSAATSVTLDARGQRVEIPLINAESGLVQSSNASGVHLDSAGLPSIMSAGAALSTAIGTAVAGPFNEVDVMGDWDGREDDQADHGGKVQDFSAPPPPTGFFITREAISEHTIANGFTEDIFYHGDSLGNLYVASSTNLTQASPTPNTFTINLVSQLANFGPLNSDDQIVVTGIAVNPVADLGAFSAINAAYAPDFPAGLVGEIVYVSFTDNGGGFRLLANNTLVRSGVLAFPVSDGINPAAPAPPQRISPANYPVTVGGPFAVAFSAFDNIAGCAVDDDGNLYFQQVDLIGITGANIVKVTSIDSAGPPGGPPPLARIEPWSPTTSSPSLR